MNCRRCGEHTPRLTLSQTRCPRCEAEVAALIKVDTERRSRAKDLRGAKDMTGALVS